MKRPTGLTDLEKELLGALKSLVKVYVANKDTKHEFIACVTPRGIPWYWVRTKQAIERAQKWEENTKRP